MGIGSELPDMPLFLADSRYVNAPLAQIYDRAFRGVPSFYQAVLDKR